MHVSVSDAKAQLTDLVRRAEAGEEIVLTRHGQPVVRITPVKAPLGQQQRSRVIAAARHAARSKSLSGPTAARSQDFLYGDDGLPE